MEYLDYVKIKSKFKYSYGITAGSCGRMILTLLDPKCWIAAAKFVLRICALFLLFF